MGPHTAGNDGLPDPRRNAAGAVMQALPPVVGAAPAQSPLQPQRAPLPQRRDASSCLVVEGGAAGDSQPGSKARQPASAVCAGEVALPTAVVPTTALPAAHHQRAAVQPSAAAALPAGLCAAPQGQPAGALPLAATARAGGSPLQPAAGGVATVATRAAPMEWQRALQPDGVGGATAWEANGSPLSSTITAAAPAVGHAPAPTSEGAPGRPLPPPEGPVAAAAAAAAGTAPSLRPPPKGRDRLATAMTLLERLLAMESDSQEDGDLGGVVGAAGSGPGVGIGAALQAGPEDGMEAGPDGPALPMPLLGPVGPAAFRGPAGLNLTECAGAEWDDAQAAAAAAGGWAQGPPVQGDHHADGRLGAIGWGGQPGREGAGQAAAAPLPSQLLSPPPLGAERLRLTNPWGDTAAGGTRTSPSGTASGLPAIAPLPRLLDSQQSGRLAATDDGFGSVLGAGFGRATAMPTVPRADNGAGATRAGDLGAAAIDARAFGGAGSGGVATGSGGGGGSGDSASAAATPDSYSLERHMRHAYAGMGLRWSGLFGLVRAWATWWPGI